ncbi:MAG TPA: hypothetical protein VM686_15520 [Polyangiaceae bacterium]|jgi:hypothetical protein|nr:hypothetical protein [Polyangiaceae bacterium]
MSTHSAPDLDLPSPIASYFARETTSPQALSLCFTEDATVVDERRAHHGRAAIAAWIADATGKYTFTTELLDADRTSESITVRAKLAGNFPGSPVELRYHFTLEGDRIRRLEIAP